MSKEYIKAQTPLPAYFPYPKFLLQMSLSHTARLTYVLLLDRMTLSQKNGWVDVQGRAYVLYPLAGLAEDLQDVYKRQRLQGLSTAVAENLQLNEGPSFLRTRYFINFRQ